MIKGKTLGNEKKNWTRKGEKILEKKQIKIEKREKEIWKMKTSSISQKYNREGR